MITQPAGVPDDGTPDDCIAAGPIEAQALALAEMNEQWASLATQGEAAGDVIATGTAYTPDN